MSIRLIVSDMDGTLLNYEDQISDVNLEALLSCQQKGIKLILASGRVHGRLLPYAKQLKLDQYDGKLIEVNGMGIFDPKTKNRIIFGQISRNEILLMCQKLLPLKSEIQIYFDDGFYFYFPESLLPYKTKERHERNLPDNFPWPAGSWSWNSDTLNGYPKQKQINNFNEIEIPFLNKVNISHNPEVLDNIFDDVFEQLKEKYQVVRTCPRMIEITPKSVSKGQALKWYMNKNNISYDEVISFGDGGNDIDMFKEVKYSIAMGNASSEVKKNASYITSTNTENGIAKALHHFILD